MCFRPPIIEGDIIKCPMCGAVVPIGVVTCPNCGATQADAAAAAPPMPTPAPPAPKAPGAPPNAPRKTQPAAPGAAATAPTAAAPAASASAPAASAASAAKAPVSGPIIVSEVGSTPEVWVPDRVPQVGGQIPMPSMPEAPGFEAAPDISGTGNYFTSGKYENG